ncbi:hypothetical protein [Janibacter sp. GS2]|uniref:hypothetical protein n=1 Tax=Janibacter sp. GS2 TaxID=3442646 RepID=UPI003EBC4852
MKQTLRTRGQALAVAVVLAAGAAGCSVNSPFQTAKTQSIADGVAVNGLDGAEVNNIALVGGEAGGEATVTGAVENTTNQKITFTISAGGSKASTTVPPNTLITLGEKNLTLKKVKDGAGDMTGVEVGIGDQSVPVDVPVVAPTGYYEEFAPKGYTAPPTPSAPEAEEH